MNNTQTQEEIDLIELFFYLIRRWWQLLIGLIIGAIIAGVITYMRTPTFESQSMLYILSKTTSITSMADLQIGNALSNDFVIIATSKPVLDTAIANVAETTGISLTREEAVKLIKVNNETNTRLLTIKVTSENAQLSCDLANAVAEATAEQMSDIMKSDPPTTVERAEVAQKPVSKHLARNVAIGALIGLVIIAIINIIMMLSNDSIKTPDDVEKYLEATVLVSIPMDKNQEYQDKQRKKKQRSKKKS